MTHRGLVKRAERLLLSWGLSPVYCEKGSCAFAEFPDAIGWNRFGESHLIEVKTSVADFKADSKKPHRIRPETGVGDYRWYLVPEAIKDRVDAPAQWGILVHYESSDIVRKAKKAEKMPKDAYVEISHLRARINEFQRLEVPHED